MRKSLFEFTIIFFVLDGKLDIQLNTSKLFILHFSIALLLFVSICSTTVLTQTRWFYQTINFSLACFLSCHSISVTDPQFQLSNFSNMVLQNKR